MALHQNWFMDKKFIMFYEMADMQIFIDTTNEVIYEVIDCAGEIVIKEHDGNNNDFAYPNLHVLYEEWKSQNEEKEFTFDIDCMIDVKAKTLEEARDIAENKIKEIAYQVSSYVIDEFGNN